MNSATEKFIKQLETSSGIKCVSEEEQESIMWFEIDAEKIPAFCTAVVSTGGVFDSAFVSSAEKQQKSQLFRAYYIFRINTIGKFLVVYAESGEFFSVSAKIDAAIWDERKMCDLSSVKIVGMPDERPLLFHPDGGLSGLHDNQYDVKVSHQNNPYVYPMSGTNAEGEFQIPVGPVHAGIIEPGHFRFHVLGETINKMETRMFYLHRGVEKSVERKGITEALPLIEQISGDECVANTIAYCQAVERALHITCPARGESIRLVLAELERIYSHLSDLGGMPTDVGFYFSASRFAVLREDMLRLNKSITNHRYLRGSCTIGGVKLDLDKNKVEMILSELNRFSETLTAIEEVTMSNLTYIDRVFSTGRITKNDAEKLALVGPGARATGISCDSRLHFSYLPYSNIGFSESVESGGDVLSRFLVKISEVKQSVYLIREMLKKLPNGSIIATSLGLKIPRTGVRGLGWAEAARGTCTFLVELEESGVIKELRCRTASFRNWRALEKAVIGNLVPDFPLINKSFNLSYAGADL